MNFKKCGSLKEEPITYLDKTIRHRPFFDGYRPNFYFKRGQRAERKAIIDDTMNMSKEDFINCIIQTNSGIDMTQKEFKDYVSTSIKLINSSNIDNNIRLDLMLQMLYENEISLEKARELLEELHVGYDRLSTKEDAYKLVNENREEDD